MRPSQDPNSDKYPDRIFYQGVWRTSTQIEHVLKMRRQRVNKKWHSDPEWRTRRNQSKKKWESANREKIRDAQRKWYLANADKKLESDRRWRDNNPRKVLERNARRVFAGGMYLGSVSFSSKEREEILNGPLDRP